MAPPDLALLLHPDQLGVQVGDRASGPQQVLRLLAQAAPHGALHGHAVLLAPRGGGGGDDHVGGGALEDLREEDVEGLRDAVEHAQLLAPGVEARGALQTRLGGDALDLPEQGGQGQLTQALRALQGRRRGGPVGQAGAVPRRVVRTQGERPQGRRAGERLADVLQPPVGQAPQGGGAEPHPGARAGPGRAVRRASACSAS
ncbi:hypothetical protein [Georgenia sp. SUBG003]|uniref:hypothetical protein n=1 Tax=Georgenia sp. SUBG003 TaxID=1497974 RepID=UPI003AB6B476